MPTLYTINNLLVDTIINIIKKYDSTILIYFILFLFIFLFIFFKHDPTSL